MTVTYTSEVTTSKGFGCFLKLLARWKGSIYKIVWMDLLLFLFVYYGLNVLYIYGLDDPSQNVFRKIVKYCNKYGSLIPLSFILGFYVNLVMTRWWNQYSSIPFPDNLAILVGASIKSEDERARIVRRTIVRYVCVTFTITLTMMSPKVKKRFPTLDHFVEAGLITKDEKKIMEDLDTEYPSYSKYWLPLAWASNITTRARHEGLIHDDESVKTILEELNLFRSKCGGMLDYDWISLPLVYTQVVTIATYSYFLINAMGNQTIEPDDEINATIFYFPLIPVLEFFFYMGWLKVAETLINPYGDDDDDFEVMWMIDRHMQVCYLLVDKIHNEHPKLMRDIYWHETAPNCLPYTIASQQFMYEIPKESTQNIKVKKSEQDLLIPAFPEPDVTDGGGFWKRASQIFVKSKKSYGVPLTSIRKIRSKMHSDDEETNSIEDINIYEDSAIKRPSYKESKIVEEFEIIRQTRLQERQERMLQIINLLKSNDK